MCLMDTQHHISDNVVYFISPLHRTNRNPDKSKWSISTTDELKCFKNTYLNSWFLEDKGWGLILDSDNNIMILGHTSSNERSQIARFENGNRNNVWHGYPWDRKENKDKPAESILKIWVSKGYIDKSKMAKIRRCQLCNL